MLREMMLWTNLHVFQVRKMEPRRTVIGPASQDIFMLPPGEFRFLIITSPSERKIKQEIRLWVWVGLLGEASEFRKCRVVGELQSM